MTGNVPNLPPTPPAEVRPPEENSAQQERLYTLAEQQDRARRAQQTTSQPK